MYFLRVDIHQLAPDLNQMGLLFLPLEVFVFFFDILVQQQMGQSFLIQIVLSQVFFCMKDAPCMLYISPFLFDIKAWIGLCHYPPAS